MYVIGISELCGKHILSSFVLLHDGRWCVDFGKGCMYMYDAKTKAHRRVQNSDAHYCWITVH